MTYNPNQPRQPKGDEEGGQWSVAGAAARKAAGLPPEEKKIRAVAYGKSGKYGVEKYGLTEVEKNFQAQDDLIKEMDSVEVDNGPLSALNDYDKLDHTKSQALEQNGGFPEGHPFADPVLRVRVVNQAAADLSYSNRVGFGGALKDASQGNTGTVLYKEFSSRLPKGSSLEDVLQAMRAESEGILAKNGVSELILYHGTFDKFAKSTRLGGYKPINLEDFYRGFSSWSSSPRSAAQFGSYVVRAMVPAKNIISLPALMPKRLAGVPSFLGGSRDESEYIVMLWNDLWNRK